MFHRLARIVTFVLFVALAGCHQCICRGDSLQIMDAHTAGPFLTMPMAGAKITVDGETSDWADQTWHTFPHAARWQDRRFVPIHEGSHVSARFRAAFDLDHLYLNVEANDPDHLSDASGWRVGDGLQIVFSAGGGDDHCRFWTYGFARHRDEIVKVLAMRDGRCVFDREITSSVQVAIKAKSGIESYEIALPWHTVRNILPLVQGELGINLTYVDRNAEGSITIAQLVADHHYDSHEPRRRTMSLKIHPEPVADRVLAQFDILPHIGMGALPSQACIGVIAAEDGAEICELQAVWSHESHRGDISGTFCLKKGFHRYCMEMPVLSDGVHHARVAALCGSHGTKEREVDLLRLSEAGLSRMKREVDQAASYGELPAMAYATAAFHLEWVREEIERASPSEPVARAIDVWNRGKEIVDFVIAGRSPIDLSPGHHRLAFPSKVDGTAQPFSLYVPSTEALEADRPILVMLHGHGQSDERMLHQAKYSLMADRLSMLAVAPKGRGGSDYYVGEAEQDVLQTIDEILALPAVGERPVVLIGFSMGGYGAWRLGLRHPKRFAAVVVLSGPLRCPMKDCSGEPIEDLAQQAADLPPILVMVGALDRIVTASSTRDVVDLLQQRGHQVDLRVVNGAGHADYEPADEVLPWLLKTLPECRIYSNKRTVLGSPSQESPAEKDECQGREHVE